MLIRTDVITIGDPFVITCGDCYYMYATGFDCNGFKVRKSYDLKHWENLGVCLNLDDSWAFQDFWAPEVIYHNGKYVMHYSARRKSDKSLRIGVAIADKPEGPFIDVHNGPMFDFGYAAIDGHVFIDDDGVAYFYYSRDCSENVVNGIRTSQLYVVKLSDDLTEVVSEPKFLFGASLPYETMYSNVCHWNEGPYLLKHNGKYYLTYSANCYGTKEYCVCLAISEKPDEGFVKADSPILTYRDVESDFSGPGHNAFFKDKDGNLKMAFHIHTYPHAPSHDRKAVIVDAQITDSSILFKL